MEDVKLSILTASKIRFSRFGFQRTTMDEICRDCQISKKTLYSHFNSKDELLVNLVNRELDNLKTKILAELQEISLPIHQLPKLLQSNHILFP